MGLLPGDKVQLLTIRVSNLTAVQRYPNAQCRKQFNEIKLIPTHTTAWDSVRNNDTDVQSHLAQPGGAQCTADEMSGTCCQCIMEDGREIRTRQGAKRLKAGDRYVGVVK
jgi:hypothetical protein